MTPFSMSLLSKMLHDKEKLVVRDYKKMHEEEIIVGKGSTRPNPLSRLEGTNRSLGQEIQQDIHILYLRTYKSP